jgi:ElaB/YqjD/DUF883 family membrane-anchored ribosome-binding protein
MSDTNEARDTAELLDADGNVIPTPEDALARIEACIRANPIRTVLIALGVGYVIGKLRG